MTDPTPNTPPAVTYSKIGTDSVLQLYTDVAGNTLPMSRIWTRSQLIAAQNAQAAAAQQYTEMLALIAAAVPPASN